MSEEMASTSSDQDIARKTALISPIVGASLGALASIFVMTLNFLLDKIFVIPFVPFDLLDWLARSLPGDVITAGIDFLVLVLQTLGLGPTDRLAKAAERSLALFIFILIGIVLGVLLSLVNRRGSQRSILLGTLSGIILGIGAVLIRAGSTLLQNYDLVDALWVLTIFLALGIASGYLLRTIAQIQSGLGGIDLTRRSFLYWVGGVVVATALASIGLGELLDDDQGGTVADGPEVLEFGDTSGAASSPSAQELASRIQPAAGTRPEITSNDDFYNVDINASFQALEENSWRLEIGGLVQNPLSLTLEDLRSRTKVTQVITLQCISNRIGGDLTGTAKWGGVPLADLLDEAGLLPEVAELRIDAADGFYESVSMQDIQDPRTLLVYEMNGEPLPHEHGFPLRIYIPNRYGMKQPKWIVRMNAIDFEGNGYWVDRGWSEEAFVVTTSVVDTDEAPSDLLEGDLFPVGGIAYSGARGISKVEVKVDDGEWEQAQLRNPPLSSLTWVQWRYDWPAKLGSHTFQVRTYDEDGVVQIQDPRGVRPDGATGIHSQKIRI
jgi:DMSO/TMAO reductase YedYZ molybdopterin-dependent catalytic subunit